MISLEVSEISNLLAHAEDMEQTAREQEGIDAYTANCDNDAAASSLFAKAWQGYHAVLPSLREAALHTDDEAVWALLAKVLLDIDIHPNSMERESTGLYWEAQYCYLRLHFTTGKPEYLAHARMCEAFRYASVQKVDDCEGVSFC